MSCFIFSCVVKDAGQREHDLRAVFNALRYVARRMFMAVIPNDLAPWHTVYQQFQRWLAAGVFEALVADVQVHRTGVGRAQGSAHGDLHRQLHVAVQA